MHITNRTYLSRTNGLTLIELLIAMAINLLLLLALTSIFSSNVGHYNTINKTDMLNQQLQSAMQFMVNDIRRAGYWANASNDLGTGANTNPYMAAATDVTINGSSNCILFSYDFNKDGSLPGIAAGSDDERYGFRLQSSAVQARPPGAAFDCAATATAWENITDTNLVNVTALTFTLTSTTVPIGSASNTIRIRSIDITLTGQLVSDATVTKTLTEHVRIRNDKYVP
jgi:prepilin-type N-terminal cleavage/methylation domain-containing protein